MARRPTGVTILAILAILIGLVGIGGGALLLLNPNEVIAALSIFAVIIGALYIAAGIGFLRGDYWAWILGLIVSALALARNFAEAADGSVGFAFPGIIVAAVVIAYLARPGTKRFFVRRPTPLKENQAI